MSEEQRLTQRRLILSILVAVAALLGLLAWLDHGNSVSTEATSRVPSSAKGPTVDQTVSVADFGEASAPAANAGTGIKRTPQSAIPMPPTDTPLAQAYDDLKALSDAGDPTAASRLFAEARRCFSARQNVRMLPRAVDYMLNDDTTKLGADQLASREHALADIESKLATARAEAQACEGLTESQLQLAPLTRRAAQLGDSNAANCYVGGLMLYAGGLLDHPEWIAEYKSSALEIAQQTIERGNWQMVAQLQEAYAQDSGFAPLGQLTGANPAQNYRLLRLLRLGATAKDTTRLDRDLSAVAQVLAPQDIADGDAWAERLFRNNFNSQPVPLPTSDLHSCSM